MKKYTKSFLLEEIKREYDRIGTTPNSRTFHIHQNIYRHHFGSWNRALNLAEVPIKGRISAKCKHCGTVFDTTKSSNAKFCSRSCSASYNNHKQPKRKRGERKKQLTPLQKWKKNIIGPYTRIYFRKCRHCGSIFPSFNKRWYCKEHINLYSTPNRDRYRFQFNVYNYPDLFDVDLISSIGWYDGTPQTIDKLTRDHKVSIQEAIRNNYNPYYITHPINCEIMTWKDNHIKGTNNSISYEELIFLVDEYESRK